jgi:Tol biopolymer transport system component
MAFAVRSDTSVITTVRLLTRAPDTLHLDASISPDGRFVAYAAGLPGRLRIFVREVGGQSAIQITSSANVPRANTTTDDHRWPRWSPDNATIAFSAGSRIYQVPMLGGPPRLVVDSAVFPAWSPDGKHLAYVYGRVLFVMPAMGGTARQIDTGTGPMLSWSPDGRRIAFAQQTGLYLGVTGIGYGAEGPASLWTIDADGRNRRRLIDDDYMNTCPVWGHDGRSIYFISNRDGGVRDIYRQRLGHDGAAHGPPERMTTGASVFSFTLSRDGSRIAYSTLERRREIWMAPIGVGETPWTAARPVTHEKQTIEGFMLSHDRRWIVYSAFRDGASHIFKVGFDGRSAVGQPIQLTRAPAHDASPRWSPDDRAIAFHRDGHAGTRDVFVVDADGRNEQRVTNGPGQKYDPDWSPDGREIVYRMAGGAGNGNNIYVVSRAAGAVWSAPRLVTPASGRGVGQSIRWSPSGPDLAFAGGDGRGVGLMLATGGPMRTIARMAQLDGPARFIAWGRDASHLYAMTFDSSTVASYWQVDVEGGPPRRILHLSDPTRQARETRFDADDRHVFFSIASDNADVFVASLRRR